MLMRHSLRSLYKSYHRKVQHSIAQLKVLDVQDNYLYVVEDYDKKLSYLREIETVQGERGIVLKLDEQCRTYVAMYRINPQFYTTLEIAHHDLPWQQSYEPIYESLLAGEMNKMFSVEGKTLYALQTSQTTAPYKR